MTHHQKVIALTWSIAAIFVVVLSVAGYAFLAGDDAEPEYVDGVKTLEGVISSRTSWDPGFQAWFGKAAGDLAVKDLEGKVHNLSDYRGKNVVVVFWATWCPACNVEIPHLIKLREKYAADDLQILAVSNERDEVLNPFVKAKGINYTVATFVGDMGAPFNRVRGIPTSFFVDREGNLKFAAVGLVPLEDTIDIINAP